ncbi:bacterio-opsin activator domain-containing protein [Halomarina pelagica]|uniref:bacterio-opsin activator domain-containing protein n=1 Tax=Halomarina pelagica TaxID=2961599 RepID=UPI0020C5A2D1|nr:bacterio-opsin activator domain-containing protein [Halomarina sp. BND7]
MTAYETLERRERGLSALSDATRELMHLDSDDIADRAADIVRTVLDVTFASTWFYDGTTGELERHASSTDDPTVTALAELYEDRAWRAFVTERTDVRNDLPPPPDAADSETSLRSGVIVPLGRHGVFCAGSAHADAFDGTTVDLANTLGRTIETALDRAERERTLEEKNEHLERLNRINNVIRGIGEALVEADTRTEIERIVCERLAASDPYRFVWIGERDRNTGAITARARAGGQAGYLDGITITADDTPTGRGPVGTAVRTRKVQVVQDVLIDPSFKPWREETLSRGFRSCISVPLVYQESFYGVLNLYADTPNVFDEMERTVLAELGETIAHSIDAAETRRTLRTDHVVELTLKVRADDVLGRLARDVGREIEFEGLVPESDGVTRLFFTTRGTPPEEVRTAGERLAGVEEIRVVRGDETECVFEAVATEPTLASHLVGRRAVVRSLTATVDDTTAVVDLPTPTDVRELVRGVRAAYPDTELVARHTRDRTIASRQDLRAAVEERLTDRQREILETAYLSGFFESPRARTGKELSESLGISQPTFASHLREAERRLCEMVFGRS